MLRLFVRLRHWYKKRKYIVGEWIIRILKWIKSHVSTCTGTIWNIFNVRVNSLFAFSRLDARHFCLFLFFFFLHPVSTLKTNPILQIAWYITGDNENQKPERYSLFFTHSLGMRIILSCFFFFYLELLE